MKDWYDSLEPEIRFIVKKLRDNGVNTTCSCGHEMYVEAENYGMDLQFIESLLLEEGYRNFKIEAHRGIDEVGLRYKGLVVWLPKKDGSLSKLAFHYGSGMSKSELTELVAPKQKEISA